MLGVVHSRRYTNVLSWEWVGCKGYVGGNRRELMYRHAAQFICTTPCKLYMYLVFLTAELLSAMHASEPLM